MFYMGERLGAWQIGDDPFNGKVEFKLFFPSGFDPQIQSIRVAGDFQSQVSPTTNNWDFPSGFPLTKANHPEGTIWSYRTEAELQAGFY